MSGVQIFTNVGLNQNNLTGDAQGETASSGDNDKSLATTEFVQGVGLKFGNSIQATGTGKFNINLSNEVIFDRFFSKKLILGNDIDEILLADPHYLVPPYFMRLELVAPTGLSVDINKVCKVVTTQIIYREKTLTSEIPV